MLEPVLQSKVLLCTKTGVHGLVRLNACLHLCNFLLNACKIAAYAVGFKILVFPQFIYVYG